MDKYRVISRLALLIILVLVMNFFVSGSNPVFAAAANSIFQAHNWSAKSGNVTLKTGSALDGDSIATIAAGDWVRYSGVDFGGGQYKTFMATVACPSSSAGKTIEIRLDSATGTRIGTLTVAATEGWDDYTEQYAGISSVSGIHDLYLVFPSAPVANINWFTFSTYNNSETTAERTQRLQWFREDRFGQFIHWGAYAYLAGTYNGQTITNSAEWIMNKLAIPKADYENAAAKPFNPTHFNAVEWVNLCKNAGQKYMVITSKHHDGFSMFDTKIKGFEAVTDPSKKYSIVQFATYKQDPIAALSQECKRQGIKFCLYHSISDWHHSGQSSWGSTIVNKSFYVTGMKEQLRELIEKYDPEILWFDGKKDWFLAEDSAALYRYLRTLKPALIINNRIGGGGDYDTPERTIPPIPPTREWETCEPISASWGYKSYDTAWKSTSTLMAHLVECAAKGGNLLLNIGPKGDGANTQQNIDRLNQMGAWLNAYGESIYGTRGSIYSTIPSWGFCTVRTGKMYLHVMTWPTGGQISVPKLGNQIIKVYTLKNPTVTLNYTINSTDMVITLPGTQPDQYDSVIAVEVIGDPTTSTIVPTPTPTPTSSTVSTPTPTPTPADGTNLALNKPVTCSSEQTGNEAYKLVDGDAVTNRWSASPYPQWVRIDLGAPYNINQTELAPYSNRAYQYRVEVSTDGTNFTQVVDQTGNTTGSSLLTDTFSTVNARYVRVTVTGCYNYTGTWASINEFRVYGEEPAISPTPTVTVTPSVSPVSPTPTITATPSVTPSSSTGPNLALNKPVTCSSEQTGNEAVKMVDNDTVTRWSASPYPQWIRIDLGAVYSVNKTELVPYSNRAYQYKVEVSTDGSNYTQVADRTGNTTGGSLFTDTFAAVNARYVRLTVTGCYNYTGTWASVCEFRVFGSGSPATPTITPTPTVTPTPTIPAETNLALNKPVTCSSEQTGNEVYKLVDGDAVTNRWSASPYPQWARIDLGAVYSINKTELVPISNRAYQYKVEVSTDGVNYIQVVDRTGNTTGGSLLTDTFTAVSARYVRLTVTGCYNYTGTWISIVEFRVFGQ